MDELDCVCVHLDHGVAILQKRGLNEVVRFLRSPGPRADDFKSLVLEGAIEDHLLARPLLINGDNALIQGIGKADLDTGAVVARLLSWEQ